MERAEPKTKLSREELRAALHPPVTLEDVGRISVAGPLANILQSYIATLIYTFAHQQTIMIVGVLLASLNAYLALFNLIPFPVMDGKKAFDWNRAVWLILFASAIALWAYVRFLSRPF